MEFRRRPLFAGYPTLRVEMHELALEVLKLQSLLPQGFQVALAWWSFHEREKLPSQPNVWHSHPETKHSANAWSMSKSRFSRVQYIGRLDSRALCKTFEANILTCWRYWPKK
eukprot:4902428-Amphidinium_carterae.1